MHISKNNGGHNSKTLSNFSPLKRKTIFSILAIFKSHLLSKIIISEKKPFAQHFMYIESLIWLHSHPLSKILTNPSMICQAENSLRRLQMNNWCDIIVLMNTTC